MKKGAWGEVLRHASLIFLVALTLFPLYFLIITSFKDYDQFIHHFWEPTLPLRLENYVDAWLEVKGYIGNSLLHASIVVLFVVLFSTISAYVFARHSFPGKELLFYLIIGVLMIPPVLMLIPQFLMVRLLGLLDTRTGLLMPMIAGGKSSPSLSCGLFSPGYLKSCLKPPASMGPATSSSICELLSHCHFPS